MRTHIFAACGVLVFAGFTGHAQTPQAPPAQPTTSSAAARPASDDKPTLTVTGCVTSDSRASSSASPTGASRSAQYILTNVQETGAPASATPSAGKSYVLKSDAGVDLSAHVNHKVQITGSLDKSGYSSSSAASPSPATAPEKAHDSMKAPTLKVSNLTMVSSTCS